jgi:serine/threonine protein kinase/Tol biopolymer transport system component
MIGQTVSHYRILEKLGEGGMGVVYKAQDTTLDRVVALKFLPTHLSSSDQDKARFVQEAKAAAALNHPNICTIYGIEEHDGQMFIAMEFVEGSTLRDKTVGRIGDSPLQIKQAVEMGIQLADGLAAAHEKGIVHRDLKPENIMLQKDGRVRIMDFGLAKLKGASRLTKTGSTVGTAGYMSPEQVQGLETDHRTDIFSLGVLLYEMIVGQSPFKGVHETAINYEIVNVDPQPMSALKPDLDPELDRIVFECMQKEEDERYQSAKDISKELKRVRRESSRSNVSRTMTAQKFPSSGGHVAEAPPTSKRRSLLWPGVGALVLVAGALWAWSVYGMRQEVDRPVMRFSVSLPDGAALDFGYGFSSIAVSPDGRYFAYVSTLEADPAQRRVGSSRSAVPGTGSGPRLVLRPTDSFNATVLPGTENAGDPSFSPDGQWVVYFSDGRLKKSSTSGGAAQELSALNGVVRGTWWGDDGMIYFGHISGGIHRVSETGGAPEQITTPDTERGEISHRFPQLLPDRETLLFTVKHDNITTFDDAVVQSQRIGTNERKVVLRGGTSARYVPTGHLVYGRDRSLFAVPFDVDRVELIGTPVAFLEGGMVNQSAGSVNFGYSKTGVLAYVPGGPLPEAYNSIVSIDRQGKVTSLIEHQKTYFDLSVSPDGQKVALSIAAANDDVWVHHIVRKTLTRLTFGGGNKGAPIWSPDGRYIVYSAERGRASNLFRRAWDGSTVEERLTESAGVQFAQSFSPDGKLLCYIEAGKVWMVDVDGERKPSLFLDSPFTVAHAAFSPDGRWVAYSSNESGRFEVYVTPFPKRDTRWQVSNGGGDQLMWSPNGQELFYVTGSALMGVQVSTQPVFSASVPRKLFDLSSERGRVPATQTAFGATIRISPDGQRFVMILSRTQDLTTHQIDVVLEWFAELRKVGRQSR